MLRYIRTPTTRHIRFAPDYFVVDKVTRQDAYLLEIKATRSPLYSARRIRAIRDGAHDSTLDWNNIGQMEALAYDNYLALSDLGVRVAVLNYCAYHCESPLLCDFVERYLIVHRDAVRGETARGSGTPWVNFDARRARTLLQFFCEEHRFGKEELQLLIEKTNEALLRLLPVIHNERSPLK